jgi:hypothetical protein
MDQKSVKFYFNGFSIVLEFLLKILRILFFLKKSFKTTFKLGYNEQLGTGHFYSL